jgi:hypothetical protein
LFSVDSNYRLDRNNNILFVLNQWNFTVTFVREHLAELVDYSSIYLSIYDSRALVDLGRVFTFLIYTQSVGLLGRGITSSQGRYLQAG